MYNYESFAIDHLYDIKHSFHNHELKAEKTNNCIKKYAGISLET